MTNAIAFTLVALIALAVIVDQLLFNGVWLLQTARAFVDFADWLAFWN